MNNTAAMINIFVFSSWKITDLMAPMFSVCTKALIVMPTFMKHFAHIFPKTAL